MLLMIRICCSTSIASCEAMASSHPLLLLFLCSLGVAKSQLKVFNLRANDLPSDLLGISDGYVKVFCGSANLGETSVRHNEANPWWGEEFSFIDAHQNDVLRLEVYDSDIGRDDLLGICQCRIKLGNHEHECFLEEGGILHYSYTLN